MVISCSLSKAAVVHMMDCKAESSLTLHESDVTPYLTLNHLFNIISSPFIIADNENEVQKHSELTAHVHGIPPVTFSWRICVKIGKQ